LYFRKSSIRKFFTDSRILKKAVSLNYENQKKITKKPDSSQSQVIYYSTIMPSWV
jgi:hypothetical protein